MADLKHIKLELNSKKQELQRAQDARAEWTDQLAELEKMAEVSGESPDIVDMRAEMQGQISGFDATLNKLRPEIARLEAQLPQAPEPAAPKFDPEKHPLLRKAVEKQEPEKAVVFSAGDMCEAQWTDKSWYKAKIQSVLGSVSAPKYLVRFIEYGDTMTIDRAAVRPLPSKRKQNENASSSQPAATATSSPHVISGPASVNPSAQVANNTTNESTEPVKPSRVPTKGALKKRQSNWQDWQTKSTKKGVAKKDSQFRTSTEFGSRVGFTGSGKGMTETHKRKRYDHKGDADNDDDYPEPAPQSRKRF
ncbi:hypothetical protein ACN47E_002142 [Coniothyrium glycines]